MEKVFSESLSPANATFSIDELPWQVKHIPTKRLFDLCFSCAVLVLLCPVYLLITALIRLTSKGKAIYSHRRVGRGGTSFCCYKFRTMYADADERLAAILAENPAMKKEWEESHKLKNDPRVTPIGKILRKFSLDELPQFWNVMIGDLSIVGPRPVVQEEIDKYYCGEAVKVLSIRPGITGLWQVSGRNDTSYKQRVLLDVRYVDENTFWLDLNIILKTVPAMVASRGAY